MVRFRVEGLIPPKKDGGNSVWRKSAGIEQLKMLRRAAADAFAGSPPYDEPVSLRLRVYVPAGEEDPTLWVRRRHGDLDNFVTGVCDGLQAADPCAFDDAPWADVTAEEHPSRPIAFTDDSWIRRIEAELLDAPGDELFYEVEVEAIGRESC